MIQYRVDFNFGDERGWISGKQYRSDFDLVRRVADNMLRDGAQVRIVEMTERIVEYPPTCKKCKTSIAIGEQFCVTHDPRE